MERPLERAAFFCLFADKYFISLMAGLVTQVGFTRLGPIIIQKSGKPDFCYHPEQLYRTYWMRGSSPRMREGCL